MKRFAVNLFIAAALTVFVASGSIQLQPEHQAYVLFLGMETNPDNSVHISALCPKIAGNKQAEYQLFESDAPTVAQAFRALERTIPRHVVYVQLKSLLLTPEFAGSNRMNELIYYLLLGAEYYSDAWVMITETPASTFLADYKPAIGTRLSASIQATMANAVDQNMVPDVHLADMLDGWHGLYGDVPAVACRIETYGSSPSIRPEGACLFAEQQLSVTLDAEETALLNWLRGDMGSLHLTDGDNIVFVSPELPPKVEFVRETGRIFVTGYFVQHEEADTMRTQHVQYLIEDRLQRLMEKCRNAGSEPFRFSEYAAAKCTDLVAFKAWDFRNFYQSADFSAHAVVRNELT